MNKHLIRQASTEIAHQLRNRIEENQRNNPKPFSCGQEEILNDLTSLIDNIEELYNHPRKNKTLLSFLNMFMESEML